MQGSGRRDPCMDKAGQPPGPPRTNQRSTPAKTDATVASLPAAPPHHPPGAHHEQDPRTTALQPGWSLQGTPWAQPLFPVPSYTMTAPSPPPVEGTLAKPFPTSQPEPEIPSGALCVHPRRCPEQSWLTYRASRAQIRLPSTLPDGAVVAASWQQAPSDQSAAKPAPSMSTVWATGRSRRPAAAGAMVGCSWAGSPWQGLLGSPWPPACTGC